MALRHFYVYNPRIAIWSVIFHTELSEPGWCSWYSGLAIDKPTEESEFDTPKEQEIFLFEAFTPTLWFTQASNLLAREGGGGGVLFPGVKRPGRETDNSSQSHVTVKNDLSSSTYMGYFRLYVDRNRYVASVSLLNPLALEMDI